jgi:hypothetical protein
MGMDLLRDDSTDGMHFTNFTWSRVLSVARAHGWVPAGTRAPSREWYARQWGCRAEDLEEDPAAEPWSGIYDSSDFQEVTAEDARALGDAIERALQAAGDASPLSVPDVSRPVGRDQVLVRAMEDKGFEVRLMVEEHHGIDMRQMLREFVVFCRGGGFRLG